MIRALNILVACEESQAITKELRLLGHNAFSCDLLKCSGGHPEWHFNTDVFKIIKNKGGDLQTRDFIKVEKWDMMIAHPPCTYLASSGARWYYDPIDKNKPVNERRPHPLFPNRAKHREEAVSFFLKLWRVKIDKVVIENPIGIMSSRLFPPTQIVHPYMFGDKATKSTCLWIRGLEKLMIDKKKLVSKGEVLVFPSGKKMQVWYAEALAKSKNPEERRTLRSKTFRGMAKEMALQWAGKVN
jgi:hypothetical protein